MMSTIPVFKKRSIRENSVHYICIICLLLLFFPEYTLAQQGLIPGDTGSKEEGVEVPAWPPDSLGRRNPQGTVEGFIQAVADENYRRAGLYLRIDSALKRNQDREALAKSLHDLLDKSSDMIPYSLLSDNESGLDDDNIGPNLEKVGTATLNNEQFDILLERTEGTDGGPIWLFSSETIQRIPLLAKEAPVAPLIDRLSPDSFEERKWEGVPVSHWLGAVLLLLISYLIAWGITHLVLLLIPLGWRKAKQQPTAGIIRAFALPVRIYLTVWIFTIATEEAGISIILRQRFSSLAVIVAIVALLLLFWELLDVISRFFERRLGHRGNQAGVSAVLFLRRAAKVAMIVLAIILILDTFGFDVTTGLAALGIGGIALALGAQKTMENFVGSVTLIADQPIRVGDFCKVGDIVGTVEQIGMRSTRIRSLQRTIVTIPNGEFSSEKIENFAHRDRFLFTTVFGFRFETTPDQIRFLLVELRSVLYSHPKVEQSSARVRFIEIGTDALKLEVFSYILAADFDRFLEIREDIYLRMMDVVAKSGTAFAFPSQTLYLGRDESVSAEKTEEVEKRVKQWNEAQDLQIPSFDPEKIAALKDSIPYPPEGSVERKSK